MSTSLASLICSEDVHRATAVSHKIVTMLPSSPHVKSVYNDGIIPALKKLESSSPGTLCIDSTTLDVNVARQVAKDVIATKSQMVDAPVSGGESK